MPPGWSSLYYLRRNPRKPLFPNRGFQLAQLSKPYQMQASTSGLSNEAMLTSFGLGAISNGMQCDHSDSQSPQVF